MAESWTTEQELKFIKNLGTYRQGHEITPMRLSLLEKYVQTARERCYWGTMHGEQVIKFAEAQLAEEHLKTGQTPVPAALH
jgi:hypothetical protein